MRRRRFQKGSLYKTNGAWVARWKETGKRKARTLGQVSEMTKAQAQAELAAIVAPTNGGSAQQQIGFTDFVKGVYLPFYRGKWKQSTAATNEDRLKHHLSFGARSLVSFTRDELQTFLDQKAVTLSYSVVAHLRWDLKQIFEMAVEEGYLQRNPAKLLYIPRECRRAVARVMDMEQVRLLFSALEVREQLIAKLAVLAGMRPGEIFGLKWARLEAEYADIRQRVYRGEVGTPKTARSVRWAALSDRLLESIREWKVLSLDTSPDAWVFPSEAKTPMSKDNCRRRCFLPKLKAVGLDWVSFQVMRRTPQFSVEGAGCRSTRTGRSDGPDPGRERERLHDHVVKAAQGCCKFAGEGHRRLSDSK